MCIIKQKQNRKRIEYMYSDLMVTNKKVTFDFFRDVIYIPVIKDECIGDVWYSLKELRHLQMEQIIDSWRQTYRYRVKYISEKT